MCKTLNVKNMNYSIEQQIAYFLMWPRVNQINALKIAILSQYKKYVEGRYYIVCLLYRVRINIH